MRYEIGWALKHERTVIPALLDRATMPDLPPDLADLAEFAVRQACWLHPGSLAADLETLADKVVDRLGHGRAEGVVRDRPAIDAFLAEHLPRMQRWGTSDRGDLAEIAMAVLQPAERLLDLTPCRVGRTPRGSWVLVTSDRYVRLVGRDTPNTTRQMLTLPLHEIAEVSLRRGWPPLGGSDEVAIRTVGETVVVSNVFRSQAERLCALLERLIDGTPA
jgi:hypothetical protein